MATDRPTLAQSRTSLAVSFLLMGTVVTIRVVGESGAHHLRESIDRAIALMRMVEQELSRFDEESGLRTLCRHAGQTVLVSPVLFHALKVAVEMADLTDGVFDPTIAPRLLQLGFNRHYLTQNPVVADIAVDPTASFRDIILIDEGCQVRLDKPMLLDLGAVGKGLAIDLAARELHNHEGFAIDAGGDVYVAGVDPEGGLWHVGIENPHDPARLLDQLTLSNAAVCTSGRYRRPSSVDVSQHHLINARSGLSAQGLMSCTVVGPQALMADVVATAAFLLGPQQALRFIEQLGLAGLCVADDLKIERTTTMEAFRRE
ncbi:MAG: FAD:protein FMN transferase [Sulfobacillus acidophilus]|uniref:FAD:protein FMN transferase n=1 Tax=Sulfobacillus acidophilus TaxID=53633 RepID=A0A2T2WKP0_9FIRM|nr:MAG: FAD:protein FMN transferase [Sulfobacillus acidophilus]